MTKKEKEKKEKEEFIKAILEKEIVFDSKKEEMTLSFIFSILTSNSVTNRYIFTRYGNILEDQTVGLTECINYIGKKLMDPAIEE